MSTLNEHYPAMNTSIIGEEETLYALTWKVRVATTCDFKAQLGSFGSSVDKKSLIKFSFKVKFFDFSDFLSFMPNKAKNSTF